MKLAPLMLATTLTLLSADATLYQKCAQCHGADGKANALNKSTAIAGMSKASLIDDLNGYKAGTLNKNGAGKLMHLHTKDLSDAQIDSLAEHISKL
jgi:cytochrome c553